MYVPSFKGTKSEPHEVPPCFVSRHRAQVDARPHATSARAQYIFTVETVQKEVSGQVLGFMLCKNIPLKSHLTATTQKKGEFKSYLFTIWLPYNGP